MTKRPVTKPVVRPLQLSQLQAVQGGSTKKKDKEVYYQVELENILVSG